MMSIALPRPNELKIGLLLSVAFLLGTCLYCVSYQAYVMSVVPDVTRTVSLAMREWGIWLVFTPWAFRLFDLLDAKASVRHRVLAGVLLVFCAAIVPATIDQWTGTRGMEASLAIFLPRYAATVLVIHLLWRVMLRSTGEQAALQVAVGAAEVAPVSSEPLPSTAPHASEALLAPGTMLVSKGANRCLIRIDEIQFLSAADNYVEIHARDQQFLVRSTMAQIENALPAGHYVRIHRSHIVRIDLIDKIRTERSSTGFVHLRGGAVLPISKNYRRRLLQQRQDFSVH